MVLVDPSLLWVVRNCVEVILFDVVAKVTIVLEMMEGLCIQNSASECVT